MENKPNRLRAKLNTDGIATGCMIFSWSPNMVEAAAASGIDYVRIDAEHAWRQDGMLEHLIRAADAIGVTSMVRMDNGYPQLLRKALEIGAGAVLVANVGTVGEAEAVVDAAKFPPRGSRGFSSYCRSGHWNAVSAPDWIRWSDSEPMVGIMIEHIEAMEHVDDIMAVDGVDFVNFGPADFALSLGLDGPDRNEERVHSAFLRTIEAAQKYDKHVMCNIPTSAEQVRRHVELGLTILELGFDVDYVRNGLSVALDAMSSAASKK
jgi:4-hydroxy-2-oxoheptanedioate aldolase